jgi:hypothetical protein
MHVPEVYALRTATDKLIQSMDARSLKIRRRTLYNLAADPKEQAPISFDPNDALHRALGDQLTDTLVQRYDHELPFTPTTYDRPMFDLRGVFGLQRDTKAVRKPMTREQAQRLRALGYL